MKLLRIQKYHSTRNCQKTPFSTSTTCL